MNEVWMCAFISTNSEMTFLLNSSAQVARSDERGTNDVFGVGAASQREHLGCLKPQTLTTSACKVFNQCRSGSSRTTEVQCDLLGGLGQAAADRVGCRARALLCFIDKWEERCLFPRARQGINHIMPGRLERKDGISGSQVNGSRGNEVKASVCEPCPSESCCGRSVEIKISHSHLHETAAACLCSADDWSLDHNQ